MTFKDRIAAYILSEHLLEPGARVVVGLSGGADSSALLAVLCELGYECHAVHCHFGLRGDEADRDLLHSERLANRLGAKFCSVHFDTHSYMKEHGVSVEMACRDLRYEYFERFRLDICAEAIAVGHHREDNVETFFLNLLRGSGIHGLRAMLPKRGNIVRPLLSVSKADILEYLERGGIEYIDDSSNLCNDYKRNRLRNIILPMLEVQFPGALDSISESIDNLRANEALYNSLLPEMNNSLEGVSDTMLFEWLSQYGFNSSQCRQMLTSDCGAVFESRTHRVTICKNRHFELDEINAQGERPVLKGKIYQRPEDFKPQKDILYLDADSVNLQSGKWELRLRRPGDRIKPFGMLKGSKLVNDVLAETGVSSSKRERSYVLTLDGEILWVVGVRASANFPVTENTKNIIEIYHEKTGD